jgi:hypothetical protein
MLSELHRPRTSSIDFVRIRLVALKREQKLLFCGREIVSAGLTWQGQKLASSMPMWCSAASFVAPAEGLPNALWALGS